MMYSGKMETLDGVMTVTLINWEQMSMQGNEKGAPTICMRVLTAAARTMGTSSRKSSTT